MNLIQYIKLVIRNGKWLVIVPVVCAATVFMLTKKTKQHYNSSTTLYTGVASGYSITSTGDQRLDYFAVNNAFDNLLASAKSRETIAQVSLHLLAEHLLVTKPDPEVLGADGFITLRKLAGEKLIAKARSLKTPEKVYDYLHQLYISKANNIISAILNKPGSFYYIDELKSGLVVTRLSTSDMLQVTYSSTDPAVCQRVLEIHSLVFTANYNHLKADQTENAITYFEAKVKESQERLKTSEDNLRIFGQQYRIINYYEQTRYIAQSAMELEKEIYAQRVSQSGSKDALAALQKRLNNREKQVLNSTSIMTLRQRLSEVNADVERYKLYNNTAKLKDLGSKVSALEDSIKTLSSQYMNLNYSNEVVPRTSLIQEWVNNAIALDKADAGLKVLMSEKQTYNDRIDQFAPLGSTLKRLERQIEFDQEEYIANLHGLNLARLRQSNLNLSSNIVVQDTPFFPLKAEASTRNLLIIVAFMVGFILVIAVVVAREMMDSSIRSPDRIKKFIELPLAGVSIRSLQVPPPEYRNELRRLLTEKLIDTITPFISTAIDQDGTAQVSLLTTKNNIFANKDIQLLHLLISTIFKNVFWIVPQEFAEIFSPALPSDAIAIYKPDVSQMNYRKVTELVDKDLSSFNLFFYVSPNLAQHSMPLAIAKSSALSLLVVNADDTLRPADKEILAKIKESMPLMRLYTWLVNTDEANLDSTIGEIPKERSWLRKKVKKMITLNLR